MHVVIRVEGREREVVVDPRSPEAVVGDLLRAVGASAEGVDVGGRFVAAETALDEAPFPDGAVLVPSQRHGPTFATRPDTRPTVTVVAGATPNRRVEVPTSGTLRIGRDPSSDLVLDSSTVSAAHALVTFDDRGVAHVRDVGSRNGTWVDGRAAHEPMPVGAGDTFRAGAVTMRLDPQSVDDVPTGLDRWLEPGNIPFNRPPRAARPGPPAGTRAPAAPDDQQTGQAFRLAMIIGPILMGGAMVLMLGNIRFALFALLSPVMAISTWVSSRRQARRANAAAGESFAQGLVRLEQELDRLVVDERRRREAALPDVAEVQRRAAQPSTRLWERRTTHEDHLVLRLGSGDVGWEPPVEVPGDEVAPEVATLLDATSVLHAAAVPVDLSHGGVVGIVGHRDVGLALARSLVAQATVLHGPADLGVTVFTEPSREGEWDWAKWLPHVRDGDGRTRLVSADHEVSAEIAAALERAAAEQASTRSGVGRFGGATAEPSGPVRLHVVDDLALLAGRRAPLRALLRGAAGPAAGIVLAPTEDLLPASCTVVVEVRSELGDAEVREPARGARLEDVLVTGLDVDGARRCARDLARFEDPEQGVAGGTLPALVRLLPLLGLERVTADDVLRAWGRDLPDPGPNTPVGVGEDGVVHLDLRTDGPHGLVGGTTGSGKSELLRSLVAGMASRVDPDHLVFVLVDYKGGSAFDECARLPHTVGMVTDLDAHLGERALVSLEAELHHRERVLRDAGVTDLPEYLRAGSPAGPMPRMVVVIDEFATMAAELPDFLEALVGIAQRGRSLGVHLILATQRPRGAVNANIKANTNLRIALRVQDEGDSTDIIDTADAARIDRSDPGRAWVRRGHGDTVLVQTALSTASAAAATDPVAVGEFAFRPVSLPPPPPAAGEDDPTDLSLLVDACTEAFGRSGLAAPRQPWLPMLADALAVEDLLAEAAELPEHVVPLGLADVPARQAREAVAWDPDEGPLLVSGMVGSGTTTALLTIGDVIARRASADDVHLHAIDFGGGGLASLAQLPHCGSVVGAGDRESQFRLVRMLAGEVDRRRELDAATRADEPRLVLLVDDVGAMLAEHEGVDGVELVDGFRKVLQEGTGARVHVVVAGTRPAALPLRWASNVGQRVLLRHADPADFGTIGVRERELPTFVPGRGLHSPSRHVVQLARPGDLSTPRPAPTERPPVRVAPLPVEVPWSRLTVRERTGSPLRLPLGIDDATGGEAELVIHPGEHVVVGGPPRSGRSSALQLVSAQLRLAAPEMFQLAVVDPLRSPLHEWPSLDGSAALADMLDVLRRVPGDHRPLTVLVDDAPLVEDVGGVLAPLVTARPDLHLVVSGRSADLRTGFGHWSRPLRQHRTGLLLQPDLAADGDLLGLRLPRRLAVPLVPGRGFLVLGGEASLVQVAMPPTTPPRGTIRL